MTTRTTLLGALLIVALALLAFAVFWQPATVAPTAPSTGLKVVVVGVDGLDWFIIQKYVAEGRMPYVGHLIGRSVLGSVSADRPVLPTVGWTQLGDGRLLTEAATASIGGRRGSPVTTGVPGVARAVVAGGGSCLTIGWPGTWPAGDGGGTVVAPYTPNAPSHELALAPTFLEGGSGQAMPADLGQRVDEAIRTGFDEWMSGFETDILPAGETVDSWFENELAARWSYVSDRATVDIAAGLMAKLEPELALIHLGGLDAVSHRFVAPGMREFFPGLPADAAARYADVLPAYYEFVDASIRRLHRLTDDRTVFLICSAYGTHPTEGDVRISGSHERGAPGVFILTGPKVTPVPVPVELTTVDVAPTLLEALGREIPSDLDGRIIPQALPAGHVETYPPVYSSVTRDAVEPAPASDDAMEALTVARGRRIAGQ